MAAPFGKERFDQARLINIANGLTAMRVLLVPLFAYLLISDRARLALLVFVIAGASDMLDGLLARWLRQRTFVVLALVNIVPVWLTIMVISRDVFILIGSLLYLLLLDSEDIAATGLSKANTATQILTVIFFLTIRAFPGIWTLAPAGSEFWVTGTIVGLCALSTSVSGLQYLLIGIRKLSRA
jgi:cardiolipin synthase